MKVNGFVRISLSLNVYDLETDAVYVDEWGTVRISDPDAFFVDWSDKWEEGTGELLGASDESVQLEIEDDDEEYDAEEDDPETDDDD